MEQIGSTRPSERRGEPSSILSESLDSRAGPRLGPPNSIGAKLGSGRLAIFEVLTAHDPSGLVIPQIIRSSGVAKSTVHRVMKDFETRGLIVRIGRRRKAPVFRLNRSDDEVVDVARSLRSYVLWRTGKELEARRERERIEAQRHRMMALLSSPGAP